VDQEQKIDKNTRNKLLIPLAAEEHISFETSESPLKPYRNRREERYPKMTSCSNIKVKSFKGNHAEYNCRKHVLQATSNMSISKWLAGTASLLLVVAVVITLAYNKLLKGNC
jgi:hypothetical protein